MSHRHHCTPSPRRIHTVPRHIDNFLSTLDPFDVELIWIPGYKGIFGNERADSIAKAAVNHYPIFASTISWAREKAKSRALKAWRTEWASRSHTNLVATALSTPPLNFHPFTGPSMAPKQPTHALSKLSSEPHTSFAASTTHALSQLNQYPARAATLSKRAPTYSQNDPSMIHTDITCALSHEHSLCLSYSAPNPALKRSQNSSLNPMLPLRMPPAVLQTMVDFSSFLVFR